MKIKGLFFCIFIFTFSYQDVYAQALQEHIEETSVHELLTNKIVSEDFANNNTFNLENASVLLNISYGTDSAQRFDVYIPKNVLNAPVILMVHGGAWRLGDKAMKHVVKNKVSRWLPKGIIFISINYRMLPKADPLKQAHDVASALAKAQALAPTWGGDSKRFILMGHSAGAHLVALISTNANIAKQHDVQPWLGTVMLDSAAYDIEKTMSSKHSFLYDHAFGRDRTFWQSTSPIYQLAEKTVPMLAICSTKRKDQPCEQARTFIEKASKLGTQTNILPLDMSHEEINDNLGLPSEYTDKVEAFMRSLGLHI